MSANGKVKPMNTTDRKQFEKLILRRQDTVMKALINEAGDGADKIVDQLRMEAGITLTEEQYLELIEGVDEQIMVEVSQHIHVERQKIEIKMEDVNESFGDEEREMKQRHKEEWNGLGERKKKAKADNRQELRDLETDLARKHAGDLLEKKVRYQKEMGVVKQKEAEITAEARQRSIIFNKSKGRLEDVIRDATNRALERLVITDDREAAGELIESIPTVAEVIEICQGEDGIGGLFKRLNPNVNLLPAPPVEKEEVHNVEVEIIPTTVDEDEDDEDDEDREYDHDSEVYGENRYGRRR
jgi:hypothetical protein